MRERNLYMDTSWGGEAGRGDHSTCRGGGQHEQKKTPGGHRRGEGWKRLEGWAGPGARGSTRLLPTPTPAEASALLCEDTCSLDS